MSRSKIASRILPATLLCIALLLLTACPASNTDVINAADNTHTAANKSRLLLISIDGYRHDYTDLYQPPFLTAFRDHGASLASLRPAFPTKTFPNHLTLVTGALPAQHGIVFNRFYAPDLARGFTKSKPATVTDPAFYLAEPLWVLLERQGRKTATYFWPGSEASIGGVSPSIVKPFNKSTPNKTRLEEVLGWIGQRGSDAPAFMTLYFSQVDDAGHDHGPETAATRKAVLSLDKQLGEFWRKAQALDPQLHLVIVSDHGMQARVDTQHEPLFKAATEQLAKHYHLVGNGPSVQLYQKTEGAQPEQAAAALNKTARHFTCYTPNNTPEALSPKSSQRMGDILCVAEQRWNIKVPGENQFPVGNHGWHAQESLDPAAKDLHGIFYAQGPAFKSGFVHASQDNVHVMPLLAKVLGVAPTPNIDGDLNAMEPLLNNQ